LVLSAGGGLIYRTRTRDRRAFGAAKNGNEKAQKGKTAKW